MCSGFVLVQFVFWFCYTEYTDSLKSVLTHLEYEHFNHLFHFEFSFGFLCTFVVLVFANSKFYFHFISCFFVFVFVNNNNNNNNSGPLTVLCLIMNIGKFYSFNLII